MSCKILGIDKGLGRRTGKNPQKLIQDVVAICFPVHPQCGFHTLPSIKHIDLTREKMTKQRTLTAAQCLPALAAAAAAGWPSPTNNAAIDATLFKFIEIDGSRFFFVLEKLTRVAVKHIVGEQTLFYYLPCQQKPQWACQTPPILTINSSDGRRGPHILGQIDITSINIRIAVENRRQPSLPCCLH